MSRRFRPAALASLLIGLFLFPPPFASSAADFKQEVIYQIVIDRFFDGDTKNNDPPQSAGLYDPTHTHWRAYWGGDLQGIQQKISYLANLGVTAIWISPPVDNVNLKSKSPELITAYHGYHARDFKSIEEHFGDSSNSWQAFDALVAAAHENGIKVIVDFAPNHSNNNQGEEYGALYDRGSFLGNFANDGHGYFHHYPSLRDPDDRFQVQYYHLYDLADINQENSVMDAYLKGAAAEFQRHGVDGFRIDGMKHLPPGWTDSLANSIFSFGESFLFGEWYLENTYENPLQWDSLLSNSIYGVDTLTLLHESYPGNISDPLYTDAQKFANRSGVSLLDFPLNVAIRDVFAGDARFSTIDSVLTREAGDFSSQNDLVTFIDNHDTARFLTLNDNKARLHAALAFLLTSRGIPCIYYGMEQYLHNDTDGGSDPYNRLMMSSFDTTTPAYKLINTLSALRKLNPAIPYGSMVSRWIGKDVYIYERKFLGSVVLVAINRNETTATEIDGLNTTLPAGTYADHLNALLGGVAITSTSTSKPDGTNSVNKFTLPAHSVSVWQFTDGPAGPGIGSIGPAKGQPGMNVTIGGRNFGQQPGMVRFGPTAATIVSWSPTRIVCTTPQLSNGVYDVTVTNSANEASDSVKYTVLTGKLIPVRFEVANAPATKAGEYIFLTGDNVELGNWQANWTDAVGPMIYDEGTSTWFANVSVPAGQTIRFKFIKIAENGTVTWEASQNHEYTVPESGTGRIELNWQY
ncbi:MAG TPA: alpha-amylase family glycosyl hydrolase [Pyrinomonadaceae bacterium]|nr:alpha-amylase family glycosyl hydrolase [Pyrinomonadaceae bacterium]